MNKDNHINLALEEQDNNMHLMFHYNEGSFHAFIPYHIWNQMRDFWKKLIQKKLNSEFKYVDNFSIEEGSSIEDYTCYVTHQKDEEIMIFDCRFPGGTTFDFGFNDMELRMFLKLIAPEKSIQELEDELYDLHIQLGRIDDAAFSLKENSHYNNDSWLKLAEERRKPISARTVEVTQLLVQMKLKNFIKSLNDYEIGDLEQFVAGEQEDLYAMVKKEHLSRKGKNINSPKARHERFIDELTKPLEFIDASFLHPVLTDEQKKTLEEYHKKLNQKLEDAFRIKGLQPTR